MKGLLLKDWYILLNKGKIYFLIIPVYLLIGLASERNEFFLFFTGVFLAMLPRTLAAYDEHAHWNRYTAALPLPRWQLVLPRYLMLLLLLAGTAALMAVIHLALPLVPLLPARGISPAALPFNLSILISMTLLYAAISMPLLYRFGSERGRMIQMALMILFMVAAGVLGGLALEPAALDLLRGRGAALVFALLPGIAAVLFLLSFLLSVRWYRYVTPD